MKATLLILFCSFFLQLAWGKDKADAPLKFELLENWELRPSSETMVSLNYRKNDDFYLCTIVLSKSLKAEHFQEYIKLMASMAEKEAIGEPKIEEIKGDEFSGFAASSKTKEKELRVSYAISNGEEVWSGDYLGSDTGWQDVKQMLQSLQSTN